MGTSLVAPATCNLLSQWFQYQQGKKTRYTAQKILTLVVVGTLYVCNDSTQELTDGLADN
jgi:hypothetical protein